MKMKSDWTKGSRRAVAAWNHCPRTSAAAKAAGRARDTFVLDRSHCLSRYDNTIIKYPINATRKTPKKNHGR